MTPQKNRIWELDALRGICILGMMVVHFVFDLIEFAGLGLTMPGWFNFCQRYGHILFILISGICATLASRSFRRGVIVFCAGLLVTGVTFFMVCVLKFNRSLSIFFGILHLLGICMMLFPLFKKLPVWALAVLGAGFVAKRIFSISNGLIKVRIRQPPQHAGVCPLGVVTFQSDHKSIPSEFES